MAILKIRDAEGNIREILAIRGEKGDKGADGTMTFEDLTPEQKESLKGEKGDKGDTGEKGSDGAKGADGYTPQKGVDYFTEADKAEIIESVMQTANIAYVGAETPASDLGKDGDIYIVTE